MAENIISDTDKSSSINKRVQEDGTLIKEVDNIEVVINRSGDKTVTNSSKSTKTFFRTDPNYGPKSYDKSNKVLPLYQHQNDSVHFQNNASSVKDHLNITRAKSTHTHMQRKTSNRTNTTCIIRSFIG